MENINKNHEALARFAREFIIIFSAAGNVRNLNIERSIREFGRAYVQGVGFLRFGAVSSLLLSFSSDGFFSFLQKIRVINEVAERTKRSSKIEM